MAEEMDAHFADWYAVANPTADHEKVSLRWRGVAEAAASQTRQAVPTLVHLFLGLPTRDGDALERQTRKIFQKSDASFRMEGNGREFQVLAGSILGHIAKTRPDLGDLAALAIACLGFRQLVDGVVPDILARLDEHLRQRAIAVRRRTVPPHISAPTLDFKEEVEKIQAIPANQANQVAAPLNAVLEKTADRLARFGREVQSAVNQHVRALAAQDEELNILWWILSGTSSDAQVPFRELHLGEAALRAAKELADRTRIFPPPPSAVAFLDRALCLASPNHGEERLALADAIARAPAEWRSSPSAITTDALQQILDLAPVSLALQRSAENSNPDVWGPAVASLAGVDPNAARAPLELAAQYYHELLLLRAYSDARDEE